ncbi:isoprenoid biosynthesis glyoxalase ElbB [Bdellovibrionota bacterium FG-1]
MTKRIAVVLCGSGSQDGSEIREAVGVLWAISRQEAQFQCFSPDVDQVDVVNCLTGKTMPEKRNMRVESARIARGDVLPLAEFDARKYDALIIPGGFGAAKNLCDFAAKGAAASVQRDTQYALEEMHRTGKPIGAVCIAPIILALTFKDKGLELTLGQPGDASRALEKLGHRHVAKYSNECHVDRKNRVVSTPAYMIDDAALHDIFTGIDRMVAEILALCGSCHVT